MSYLNDLLGEYPGLPSAPSYLLGRSTSAVSTPALLVCPCGQPLGSSRCRCGRRFAAVAPMALGVGASSVLLRTSRHAPAGLVASCFFRSFVAACTWARRCPALFGVVAPRVRMVGIRAGWIVRVPVCGA